MEFAMLVARLVPRNSKHATELVNTREFAFFAGVLQVAEIEEKGCQGAAFVNATPWRGRLVCRQADFDGAL
jgi:hypothetical protein